MSGLTQRPAIAAWGDINVFTKPARKVALVRETARECNLGQGEVSAGHQLLRVPHAGLHDIIVRGHTLRLLERASEVILRQSRDSGQRLHADGLVEMGLDVFPYAP